MKTAHILVVLGIVRCLEMVKPNQTSPNDQLSNHGWFLGGTDRITWNAQADIDLLLEAKE